MVGMMKRIVPGIVLALAAVPIVDLARAHADASDPAPKQPEKGWSSEPALLRAVAKICRKGSCQRQGTLSLVQVWRNKQGKVRLLEYNGGGCFHAHITYHDPAGRFLVAQASGPREPEDWNSPDDRKIRKLHDGLTEAEYYACNDTKTPRVRARESSKEQE